jgi:hypothetical protein
MAKKNAKVLVVIREGTGRPSRAIADDIKACTPAQVRRLRDAALKGMHDEEWGWEIGRLFLQGKISADQFEAGKRWRRLLTAWRNASGMPKPDPKALQIPPEPRTIQADPDTDKGKVDAEREMELAGRMRGAHAVLCSYGKIMENDVRRTVEDDQAPVGQEGLERVVKGLSAWSSYWGLTAGR